MKKANRKQNAQGVNKEKVALISIYSAVVLSIVIGIIVLM